MSLDTATITGRLVRPDQSKWVVAAWIEVASEGGRATADGLAIGGVVPVTVANDGTATLPNPLIRIPQTGVEPAGARYRLSVQTTDGKTNAWEFDLTGDITWDQIITTANVPVTSSIQAAAEAARDQAVAAAQGSFAAFARNPDLIVSGTVTRDANGAATSAPVTWPDGSPGTYTADTLSTTFPGAVDGYHITYGSPVTKTYTQPTVTRDASGAATSVPAIVVT